MNLALLAQSTTSSGCTLNGQPVSCSELADKAGPLIGGILIFVLLGIIILVALLIFWIFMLVHAIRHNSPNKTVWLVVLIVSLILGFAPLAAIVYFFAEKKKADQFPTSSQVTPVASSNAPVSSSTDVNNNQTNPPSSSTTPPYTPPSA